MIKVHTSFHPKTLACPYKNVCRGNPGTKSLRAPILGLCNLCWVSFLEKWDGPKLISWVAERPRNDTSISRDTCSDSIAKLFRACLYWISHSYRAICCKIGIAEMCLCETRCHWWGIAQSWGVLASLKRYRAILHDRQITHLIRVRLKILLHDSFWGGSGFPGLSTPFLSCITVITYVFGHSPCSLREEYPNTSEDVISYDSKTGWAPIRCVIWRSLRLGYPSNSAAMLREKDPPSSVAQGEERALFLKNPDCQPHWWWWALFHWYGLH